MVHSTSSNSSIFQPLIDLTKWCEIETANIIKCPLPPKDKWSEIIRRIIIVCSVIIPIIGLLTMGFSTVYGDLIRDFKKPTSAAPVPRQQPPPRPVQRPPEVHRPLPPVLPIAPASTEIQAAQA